MLSDVKDVTDEIVYSFVSGSDYSVQIMFC